MLLPRHLLAHSSNINDCSFFSIQAKNEKEKKGKTIILTGSSATAVHQHA